MFRGRSLCIDIESINKMHRIFEKINKNFHYFVQKLNRKIRKKKNKKDWKERANSCKFEEYTSAFKQITEE